MQKELSDLIGVRQHFLSSWHSVGNSELRNDEKIISYHTCCFLLSRYRQVCDVLQFGFKIMLKFYFLVVESQKRKNLTIAKQRFLNVATL